MWLPQGDFESLGLSVTDCVPLDKLPSLGLSFLTCKMGKVTPTSEGCHGRCQKRTPVDLVVGRNLKQSPVCRFTFDPSQKKNHRESRENVYKLPKTKKAVQMLSLGDN